MATKYVTETENQENVKSDDILMNVIRGINGGQTDEDQQEVSEATEEAKKKTDADNSNKKNNKRQHLRIHVEEPLKFEPYRFTGSIRSKALAGIIKDNLSRVFSDLLEVRIFPDNRPGTSTIRCIARFKYMSPEETKLVENYSSKYKALSTKSEAITNASEESKDMQLIRAQSDKKASEIIVKMSDEAHELLADLVMQADGGKYKPGIAANQINWNLVENQIYSRDPMYNQVMASQIFMDIELDLVKCVEMFYNGTEKYSDYEKTKNRRWGILIKNATFDGGYELELSYTDIKKQSKVMADMGFSGVTYTSI